MAENEQLRSAEAEQERKTENREEKEQEEERRFGEGEEDEEEAFSPLPESAEQVPKYQAKILIEHLCIFFFRWQICWPRWRTIPQLSLTVSLKVFSTVPAYKVQMCRSKFSSQSKLTSTSGR